MVSDELRVMGKRASYVLLAQHPACSPEGGFYDEFPNKKVLPERGHF